MGPRSKTVVRRGLAAPAALAMAGLAWSLAALSCPVRAAASDGFLSPSPAPDDPNGPSCRLSGRQLRAWGLQTPWAELARMAQDVGAAPLRPDLVQRPGNRATALCADGPPLPLGRVEDAPSTAGVRLDWVPAMLSVYANTGYPSGSNDGAVWQGKGFSAQLGVGLEFRWGILSAAFVPGVAWQQNVAFPMVPTYRPGNLEYANPWYGDALDVPQRFGPSPYWTVTPGQSYVQLAWGGFGAGFSTENLWWGPGIRSTLLMTNNADGFPHAWLGTVRPVDIWIGNLEATLWGGSLSRSDWFYTQDRAWFGGVTLDLELRWVRGLYLGLAAVNVSSALCSGCERNSNALMGLQGRWVFPGAGVEVYGEWVREDGWVNWKDFTKELDHSVGYVLGLQKVFLGNDYWVRLVVEITDVNIPRPARDWRPNPTAFYTHSGNTGYTNGGAILGWSGGPGSSGQYLGVDVLAPSGWYGGWLERTRRNDIVFMQFEDGEPDVETGGGLRWVRTFGPLDVGASAGIAYRSAHGGVPGLWNLNAQVQLAFWPGKAILGGQSDP